MRRFSIKRREKNKHFAMPLDFSPKKSLIKNEKKNREEKKLGKKDENKWAKQALRARRLGFTDSMRILVKFSLKICLLAWKCVWCFVQIVDLRNQRVSCDGGGTGRLPHMECSSEIFANLLKNWRSITANGLRRSKHANTVVDEWWCPSGACQSIVLEWHDRITCYSRLLSISDGQKLTVFVRHQQSACPSDSITVNANEPVLFVSAVKIGKTKKKGKQNSRKKIASINETDAN